MSVWDPGQTWGAGEGASYREYHVGKLAAHAQKHMKPVTIPVKSLKHNLIGNDVLSADEPLWSKAFRRRAKRSHLKHPLMLHRDSEGQHHVIDGAHCLAKAITKGHEHVHAYVFGHDQMPKHALTQIGESMLRRTPLLLERSYNDKKELSFYGGQYNTHRHRQGLLDKQSGKSIEGIYRRGPKGPRKKRAGDNLVDEPLRHRAEPIRKSIGSDIELTRQPLLYDHHTEG